MAGITIRGLSKSFSSRDSDVAAVADVDIEIKDNSFVTLLGPSGCGKTTTLRLIAGYMAPDRGTIEVDGRLLVVARFRGVAGIARHGHGVPELRDLAAQERVRERRVRPQDQESPVRRGAPQGRGGAGAGESLGARNPLSGRAVRRPAAARCARPLAGGRARHPAARRAFVQSRRQAARAHALRAQRIAAPHRDHFRLRHPRPGRGAGAVGPDRGHESRTRAAIRGAVRGLRPSRQPHGRGFHGPGEPRARQGARAQRRRRHRRGRARACGEGRCARRVRGG